MFDEDDAPYDRYDEWLDALVSYATVTAFHRSTSSMLGQ